MLLALYYPFLVSLRNFDHEHLVIFYFFKVVINCLNFCRDWDQYKRSKCIKVLKKKETADNALKECIKSDNTSSLITISDQKEQDYINQLLKKYSHLSMFAWIGMKYNGNEYKWMDGMDPEFDNWSDEAVRIGVDPCAKMSLMRGMMGKWVDSSCESKALVVCQRKPEPILNSLKDIIQNISQIIEMQLAQFDEQISNEKNHHGDY